MTVSRGGGSAFSGSECSMCWSMGRQLVVQPHFLPLTTQALGRPKFRPVIPAIIGEQKEKVIHSRNTRQFPSFLTARVSRDGASDKLALHLRPIPTYSEGAIHPRPLPSRRRSSLDTTLEHRSDAAD